MQLSVQLFAGPNLWIEQRRVVLPVTRPLLLLVYLVFREDWVSRDELVALFWPEVREAKARQSLRVLLYRCKKEPYGRALELERTRVRCLAETDVQVFREAASRGDWQTAVNGYQGTFLERVRGDDSASFEAWLEQTRDELHVAWRDAALHVATELSGRERHAEAALLLQEVMRYDALAEDVLQACMREEALAGQKTRALATFEAFSRLLGQELALKPLEATLELADSIRRDEVVPTRRTLVQNNASFVTPLAMPQPLTPFTGRALELLELAALLADPHNRLITLLGAGGMGKSRLSLCLLENHAHRFEDGVAFVPLATLRSAADIPHAVASTLRLDRSGKGSVEQKILDQLSDKHMLIVLDNFEHVLAGAPFVERLLRAAPRCTFICTSRSLLGLANEVIYDLSGLTVPSSSHDDNLEAYDAAQLFVRSARRVRSDFSLQKRDYPALFELCKVLNGMPLALELAANWVRLFSLEDLVEELRRDVDLLEATSWQVSERHSSLRKVFEHSWQLLNPESQRVLAALSVFRGSCDRHAAGAVTAASAKTLLSLVNTSLLRATASGRFSELLVIRQYAAEKLAEQTASYRERHGRYYLNRLASVTDELKGPAPKPVLLRLEQDLENLRAAWHWACDTGSFELCANALGALRLFFTAKARFQEGVALLDHAASSLQNRPDSPFVAQVQVELAYFSRRLDLQAAARLHAERALSVARTLSGAEHLEIESLCELAIIGCWMGDLEESAHHAEQALALAEAVRNAELVIRCKSRLALAKRYLGAFDEAHRLYQAVLAHERGLGRQIAILRTLSDLGRLYVDMNEPLKAKVLFCEGLERAESQAMLFELGFMWEGLGQCSLLLGDYVLARQQVETAVRCSEAVRDSMGVAVQCAELARIHLALEGLEQAESYLRQGLAIAWDKGEIPEVMRLLVTWAALFVKRQAWDQAVALLVRLVEHPGAQAVHKREARELLSHLDAAVAGRSRGSLASAVNTLLGEA